MSKKHEWSEINNRKMNVAWSTFGDDSQDTEFTSITQREFATKARKSKLGWLEISQRMPNNDTIAQHIIIFDSGLDCILSKLKENINLKVQQNEHLILMRVTVDELLPELFALYNLQYQNTNLEGFIGDMLETWRVEVSEHLASIENTKAKKETNENN